MPNLDVSNLDALSTAHFRILTAIEVGMKNHTMVPMQLISAISSIRHGSIPHLVSDLLRLKLISHVGGSAEGYTLTYTGYDYLAINVLKRRGVVDTVGARLGVGKEADVYMSLSPTGTPVVLKFHKLGRTSFKTAKTKREYLGERQNASWMYLSRLAAMREFGFMVALKARNFPVPQPLSLCRHCVCMEFIDGAPMHSLRELSTEDARSLGQSVHKLMVGMLEYGIVHGDCNEFNVIVRQGLEPIVIDFPQVIQASSSEAAEQFDRDVKSVEDFLNRRFNAGLSLPRFAESTQSLMPLANGIEATETFVRAVAKDYDDSSQGSDDEPEAPERDQPRALQVRRIAKSVNVKDAVRTMIERQQHRNAGGSRNSKGATKSKVNVSKHFID